MYRKGLGRAVFPKPPRNESTAHASSTPKQEARANSRNARYFSRNGGRKLRAMTLTKFETAAASHLCHTIQVAKQGWQVKSTMLLQLVSNPVLSKLNPCPFLFSHTGLDRAQCCFPPAVTYFRKPGLIKASPSHIFI